MIQIAQDISPRMYVKKRRHSGLQRGFLTCIIGEIDKSRCVSYFSTVPKQGKNIEAIASALAVIKKGEEKIIIL